MHKRYFIFFIIKYNKMNRMININVFAVVIYSAIYTEITYIFVAMNHKLAIYFHSYLISVISSQ